MHSEIFREHIVSSRSFAAADASIAMVSGRSVVETLKRCIPGGVHSRGFPAFTGDPGAGSYRLGHLYHEEFRSKLTSGLSSLGAEWGFEIMGSLGLRCPGENFTTSHAGEEFELRRFCVSVRHFQIIVLAQREFSDAPITYRVDLCLPKLYCELVHGLVRSKSWSSHDADEGLSLLLAGWSAHASTYNFPDTARQQGVSWFH